MKRLWLVFPIMILFYVLSLDMTPTMWKIYAMSFLVAVYMGFYIGSDYKNWAKKEKDCLFEKPPDVEM